MITVRSSSEWMRERIVRTPNDIKWNMWHFNLFRCKYMIHLALGSLKSCGREENELKYKHLLFRMTND